MVYEELDVVEKNRNLPFNPVLQVKNAVKVQMQDADNECVYFKVMMYRRRFQFSAKKTFLSVHAPMSVMYIHVFSDKN